MLIQRLGSILALTGFLARSPIKHFPMVARAFWDDVIWAKHLDWRDLRSARVDSLKEYWLQRMETVQQTLVLPATVVWQLCLLVEIWAYVRAAGPMTYEDISRFVEYIPAFAEADDDTLSTLMVLAESLGLLESFAPPGTDHTLFQATARVPWTFPGPTSMAEDAQWTLPLDMLQSAAAFAKGVSSQFMKEPARVRTASSPGAIRTERLLAATDPVPNRLPDRSMLQLHAQLAPEQLEQLAEVFQAFLSAELAWHRTQGLYEAPGSNRMPDSLVFRASFELLPVRQGTGKRRAGPSSVQ